MPAVPASPSAQHPFLDGKDRRLGPFRLIEQLGRGGFAPVWLAEEIYDDKVLREVALKLFFLPPDLAPTSPEAARWRDGILDEARALCRVEHPNIVRFYSLQRDDALGVLGLAMEHVAGQNLDDLVRRAGRLEARAAVNAGIAVAWALAAVHEVQLVHRDVKPSNIMQGPYGYRLIDFGIVVSAPREGARSSEAPTSTQSGASFPTAQIGGGTAPPLVGTLGYIAPECFEPGAYATPSSDLFALGVTLHHLLTGALPFPEARPRTTAPPLITRVPQPSPGLEAIGELVDRLISLDPDTRPRHATWVARELERIRDELLHREITGPISGERVAPARLTPSTPEQITPPVTPLVTPPITETDSTMPNLCACPQLIGRDDALAVLGSATREVRRGGVRVVLLSGALGIGRTRLLEAAVEQAGFDRGRVLFMRCSPERKSPLRPLHRALEALPSADASELGLLLDALERALSPAVLKGADEASFALEGVEDALLWESTKAPLLLAVDDIQWGDAQTLGLLTLLVERAGAGGAGKLLVVATARDEPYPSPPLKALLGKVRSLSCPGVAHLSLAPLSAAETALLAQSISPLDDALEGAVVRGSGCVPFFVVHALNVWREMGVIAWKQGKWRATSPRVFKDVPGVAALVEARLASYFDVDSPRGRAAYRALAAVALYGGGLSIDVLYDICGDELSVERALEALTSAAILAVDDARHEYGFAQEMVRQAVLNLVRHRPWFSRLHRALLDAVAAGQSAKTDAAFLATGYEKLGDAEQARTWLGRAMDAASAAGLFREAAELGDRRAALTDAPEERRRVELDVVRALLRGRRFEEAKKRLAKMSASAGALDLYRRVYRLEAARGLSEEGVTDATVVRDADALGDAALCAEARMALAGVAPDEERMALAGEAVALAAACSPALEFAARVLRAELCYASSRRDLALGEEDLLRALDIARASGSAWQQIHIESDLAVLEAEQGRTGEAIERLRRLSEQAEKQGMRTQMRILSQSLSAFLLRQGRAAEAAEAAARTAALAAEAGDTALRASALSIRAHALRLAGDLEAALGCANEAEQLQAGRGDRMRALSLYRRAEILSAMERVDEALEDARAARRVAAQHGERDLEVRARLWEQLRLLQRGAAGSDEPARALAEAEEAKRSGLLLRPPTLQVMRELEEQLAPGV